VIAWSDVSKQWKFIRLHYALAFDYKHIIKIDLGKIWLCAQWVNGNVQLFCTLFLYVFGKIVGLNIRIRPNSDNHIFGTALVDTIWFS